MRKKRLVAALLIAVLSLQNSAALAASISVCSNNAQTAETISLNERKTYAFRYYSYETDDGYEHIDESEHYYKFVPSVTDYYDVNVENFIEGNTSIEVYDSSGKELDYGNWNQFTNVCKTNGTKLIAGNTYYVRIYTYIETDEIRPMYTTVVKHTHSYVLEDSEAASCVREGYQYYYCTKCGYSYTATIPKTAHVWNTKYTVDKEATCTTAGKKSIYCSNEDNGCEAVKTTVTIPATGHNYKLDVIWKADQYENGGELYFCNRCGKEKTVTISRPKTIIFSKSSFVYNNKVRKPTVTVKDAKGNKIASSNYTVSYAKGCKNVGAYKVTVKFKGKKYTGSLSKTFTIVPKATTLKSVTAAKKGFTAKWVKQTTQTTGYQIQYATNSKFTSGAKIVTVSKNKTVSVRVSKLAAKKKYYVRVRAYKTVSGKKYYSAWSKTKTITTKK
ncbi:MAG: fibronectin type III domain-containing protein [Eubacteriales bacterium]|nr:fibronectin type III domain-containing protein [Eubacteriales bacterium]